MVVVVVIASFFFVVVVIVVIVVVVAVSQLTAIFHKFYVVRNWSPFARQSKAPGCKRILREERRGVEAVIDWVVDWGKICLPAGKIL